jgi:ATP adenylyltransferase
MEYIQGNNDTPGCVFCNELAKPDGVENLVFYRGKATCMILNRFPYTSGHMMAIPYSHVPGLCDLDGDTRAELMELVNKAIVALQAVYVADGFNVGINLGKAAGAGVTDHVHIHIVPRWGGDTNFMSSVAQTRVLPETLAETYQRVTQAWNKLFTG